MMGSAAGAADDEARRTDWIAAMRTGDFERAWAITDGDVLAFSRSGRSKHEGPRHLQHIWCGEPLGGRRVLVRCYHGLGDTIQFARFLAPLRAIASEVVVWCQPELLRLVSAVDGVDRALPLHDGLPDVDFEVDIEIMEIPHALRATRDLVEISRPYLQAERDSGLTGLIGNSALSVGLVWDVGNWDHRRRAVSPHLLRRLASSQLRLYSLQREPGPGAVAEIGAVDISTPDVCVLAARLQVLDVVICPDTMVAHLSAALGRETWVMLHADCDWRWPASGSTTFWYPSVRLFHQRRAGDWFDVVEEIRLALRYRREAPIWPVTAVPSHCDVESSRTPASATGRSGGCLHSEPGSRRPR